MAPASNKICKLCGVGFRGTTTPEEVHCAKCFVKTCEVPEDTDEQFLKLVSECHGPELAAVPKQPLPTSLILPVMKDILGHKSRLTKLENDLEKSNKSTKEKNRMKREIYRLREEKREMECLMDGIKSKMMHLAFMTSVSSSPVPSGTPMRTVTVTDSPVKATAYKTPSPKSPPPLKVPTNTPVSMSPSTPTSKPTKNLEQNGTPLITPISLAAPNSPPRSPSKQMHQQPPPTPLSTTKPQNASPVKLTALKFEAAAKKVNNVVTFAKMPSKTKTNRAPEVNNNDTPVTASSSSGEEDSDEFEERHENGNGNPSTLTRSNSVRDRIKAFEEIQRRASTGSYDRKKSQQGRANRALSSMKSINV